MRFLVTRPRAQAATITQRLLGAGLDAAMLPLIAIVGAQNPQPVRQAWADLPGLDLVMFVSANAVQHFFALKPVGAPPWPTRVLAGSPGPGTSAALREAGVPEAALVEPTGTDFDSEALWQRLRDRDWAGRQVRIVRGEGGRDWLAERLSDAGAGVGFAAALARPGGHLWLFSSSQAIGHLGTLACAADSTTSRVLASDPRVGWVA